jgi:hypothetical protein
MSRPFGFAVRMDQGINVLTRQYRRERKLDERCAHRAVGAPGFRRARFRWPEVNDQDARQVCDLTDDELRQAAAIIRAIRALPSWTDKSYQGGTGFRVVLSGYALGLTDEIDKRAGRLSQP